MSKIVMPSIYMGGTSGRVLAEQYDKVLTALNAAKDALHAVELHSRDYVPTQGVDAWQAAQDQHSANYQAVCGLVLHYEALLMSIEAQINFPQ